MKHKPQHTYIWLKVLISALILELAIMWMISAHFSSFIISIGLALSLLGLSIGVLINYLTRFKRSTLIYITGHVLALLLLVITLYAFSGGNNKVSVAEVKEILNNNEVNDSTTILTGSTKLAIEQIIYLMEQQYPFGGYEIIDVNTEHIGVDTSTIYCTIIFTLQDEGSKKYISQYAVKDGIPKPKYTKLDTTSAEYAQYRLKNGNH